MNKEKDILLDSIQKYFKENGLGYGATDIFFLGSTAAESRLTGVLKGLLCFNDDEGGSPISTFAFFMPFNTSRERLEQTKESLHQVMILSERFVDKDLYSTRRLLVELLPDFSSQSAVNALSKLPSKSVAIFHDASSLRSKGVERYELNKYNFSVSLPEDYWFPHLLDLNQILTKSAKNQMIYVILDAGESSPNRAELVEQLNSIDGGVLGSYVEDDIETILANLAPSWSEWFAKGYLGQVLNSITSLPTSAEVHKPFLRIQALHRAGLHGLALEEIETLLLSPVNYSAMAYIKLAQICVDAGGLQLARRLLKLSVIDLIPLEGLELAMSKAMDVNDIELEKEICLRIQTLYPHSEVSRLQIVRGLLSERNYLSAAAELAQLPSRSEEVEVYTFLSNNLDGHSVPDYAGIDQRIAAENKSWASFARLSLVRDALARKLLFHAMFLITSVSFKNGFDRRHALQIIEVLEPILLETDALGDSIVESDKLTDAILMVVHYLSKSPHDAFLRTRLVDLLSVEISGTYGGIALIASIILNLMKEPLTFEDSETSKGLSMEQLMAQKDSFGSAFAWLSEQSPIVMGKLELPPSLVVGSADELMPAIATVLGSFEGQLKDEDDIKAFMNWAMLGVATATYASDKCWNLRLMRIAAEQLAMAGRVQQARDMCQQALESAGVGNNRNRLAWSTMATVYHRLGNKLESLVAYACAAACSRVCTTEDAWYEINALTRILRDIGLLDHAEHTHSKAGEILKKLRLFNENSHRHEFLGLQIRMGKVLRDQTTLQIELPKLLSDVVTNAKAVLENNEHTTPIAVMLGQLIRILTKLGVSVHSDILLLQEQLVKLSSSEVLIRSFSSMVPTAKDVLELHAGIEAARYSDDVGYDSRNIALVAKRLLAGDESMDSPEIAAFAVELMSDRAIATPGWESTAKPIRSVASISEPATIAANFSKEGFAIIFAGLDEERRLVRVVAEDGKLSAVFRESEIEFSGNVFFDWINEFPYRYGIDEKTMNLFYVTTERLRFSDLPMVRTLLVASTDIQQIPPNLLRVGDDFAGQRIPIAAVPSLLWFDTARKRSVNTSQKMTAWISAADTKGKTLTMIAERLEETLGNYKITLDKNTAMPRNLIGSKLVIVAAHGGVSSEGKFFQSISDEGDLSLVTSDFANSLRNVEIVILFVCSAGRSDQHPSAHSTTGMVKQLLDRGCSAVIASPWPLDARVTYHWLPKFLECWTSGMPLIDANFEANRVVCSTFSDDLARCLAMNVFGDAFLRFT